MKIFRLPSAGAELYTGITIVQEVFDITLITAEVKENDELLAECRMKIYLKKNETKNKSTAGSTDRPDHHQGPLQ